MLNRVPSPRPTLATTLLTLTLLTPLAAAEEVSVFQDVAVSPDGSRMAIVEEVRDESEDEVEGETTRTNLLVALVTGENAVVVDSVPACTGDLDDVAWSPDGSLLTYVRRWDDAGGGTPASYGLRVMSADGARSRTVLRSPLKLSGPDFTHDAQRLVYTLWDEKWTARTLRVVGLDGANDTEIVRGEVDPNRARRVARGEYFTFTGNAVKADGTLNTLEKRRVVDIVRADGTGLQQLMVWPTDDQVHLMDMSLCANSSRFVIDGMHGFISGQAWQIMGMAEEHAEFRSPVTRGAFCVMPDGSAVICCAGVNSTDGIYRLPFKGEPIAITLQRTNIDNAPAAHPGEGADEFEDDTDPDPVPEDAASRKIGGVTMSPDGATVAFAWEVTQGPGAGASEIWEMQADGSRLTRLTEGAVDSAPRYSPQGDVILFERLVKGPEVNHDIYAINTFSHLVLPVVESNDADETQPDGELGTLAFRSTPTGKPADATIIEMRSGVRTELAGVAFEPSAPAFAPVVDKFVFSTKAVGQDGKPTDGNRNLCVNLGGDAPVKSWRSSNGAPADLMSCRISADGSRMLALMRAEGKDHLFFEESSLIGKSAGAADRITSVTSYDLARDGSRFVLVGTTQEAPTPAIWVVNWNPGSFFRVEPGTQTDGMDLSPPESPWVASDPAEARTEVSSTAQVSEAWGRAEESWPAFSPDGARLAFVQTVYQGTSDTITNCRLLTARTDGTDVKDVLTHNNIRRPRWSADGLKLAFEMTPDGEADSEIFTCAADGTDLQQITKNDVNDVEPTFWTEGRSVAFVRVDAVGARSLLQVDTQGTQTELLGTGYNPSCPVLWKPSKCLLVRSAPIDDQGKPLPDGKGTVLLAVGPEWMRVVFKFNSDDRTQWPQSVRFADPKIRYLVRLVNDGDDAGTLFMMDEEVSKESGTGVPHCIVLDDEYDINAEGTRLAFHGFRTDTDDAERACIWMMNTDGSHAAPFTPHQ
ncbi:MAG: hypothetical protein U0637_04480 [Phycisphaerales bacterium]